MKILIVYDTKYGCTGKIAEAVKTSLALENQVQIMLAKDTGNIDLNDFDMLVVGSPTYGGRPSPAVKAFLNNIPVGGLTGKKAAAFDTGSTSAGEGFIGKTALKIFGFAGPRISKILAGKGAQIITTETFFVHGMKGPLVDGEEERALKWATELL